MRREKYTYKEVKKYIEGLGYILLDESYSNVFANLTFKDYEGYYYYSCIHNLQKGVTPIRFKKSNIYIIHNIKLWCKLNNKPFELIDGQEYINDRKKLKWRCLKPECGDVFESSWNKILHNRGCGVCHGTQVGLSNCLAIKYPYLISEWHPTLNGSLTPWDITYGSNRRDIWWICKKGHEWQSSVNNRYNGNGCPYCAETKGEKEINKILNNLNMNSIYQHTFSDCKNIRLLEYDFYLPNHITAIEYQGIQHYEPVDFAGKGEEWALNQFKETQIHDQIKRDYCKNNNINLIEIPYWDFDNIEQIIKNELEV